MVGIAKETPGFIVRSLEISQAMCAPMPCYTKRLAMPRLARNWLTLCAHLPFACSWPAARRAVEKLRNESAFKIHPVG